MRKKILIVCAGLGMGNASRVGAIAEKLPENSTDLTIASWGRGFQFLQDFQRQRHLNFQLLSLRSYANVNWARALANYWINTALLWRWVRQNSPDVIVLDSDYHFLAYVFHKVKIVFIGQASEVVDLAGAISLKSPAMRLNFLLREKADQIFQRLVSHKVLCPSFSFSTADRDARCEKTPLIVRSDFLEPHSLKGPSENIGILSSGSGWEAQRLAALHLENNGVTEWIPATDGAQITTAKDLAKHDVILCQGGMSSISECLALGKFIVVMPIRNQAELYINGMTLQRLGLGVLIDSQTADQTSRLLHDILQGHRQGTRPTVNCSGAEFIAYRLAELSN